MAIEPRKWQRDASNESFQDYLLLQRGADRELAAILRDAAQEAGRLVNTLPGKGIGAQIRRAQYAQVASSLYMQQMRLWGRINGTIAKRIHNASDIALKANRRVNRFLVRAGASELRYAFMAAADSSALNVQSRLINDISLSQRVYKNRELSSKRIDQIANRGIALNKSAQEIANDVRSFIRPDTKGGVSYAAMRLGRTELNNAFHTTATRVHAEQPWVLGVKWHLSRSHPRPDPCDEYATDDHHGLGPGVFRRKDVPGKPHPQCLVAGTYVSGLADAATSRWHVGEIIDLHTVNGRHLTVTPNHPILTTRGWVAAHRLDKGCTIVCTSGHQRESIGRNPDEEHMPSRIEDVFASLWESFGLSSSSVMATMPQDFHGDGFGGDVTIVRANSSLESDFLIDATFDQPLLEEYIDLVNSSLSFLSGECGIDLMAPSLGGASDSSIGISGPGDLLLRSSLGMDQSHGFSTSSEFDSMPSHSGLADMSFGQSEDYFDFCRRFAGVVEFDYLRELRPSYQSCQVYNLQTREGWFTANNSPDTGGVVTHNCLCHIIPVTEEPDDFLDKLVGGQYNDFLATIGYGGL